MTRHSKFKKRQRRMKQGEKLKARAAKRRYPDDIAMFSAGLDYKEWVMLPDMKKNLYRLRAMDAMNCFYEEGSND